MKIFFLILLGSLSASASEFSYEDLVQLIRERNLMSIEEVLPELPAEFRSGYTLMHTSRSLQDASDEYPRAILFGKDARLTCTFNGHPSQEGFDSFECFQFRPGERKFDFRQIQFPTADNGLQKVLFSETNKTTDGKISCNSCHRRDPRPNWDDYFTWPGAFGGEDDQFVSEQERNQYLKFVEKRPTHPRYRWLIQGTMPTDPYEDRKDILKRPNLRFSEASGRMNSLRALRILESKVSRWEVLAFGLNSLGCKLTDAQKKRIAEAGLDFEKDTDVAKIFAKVGMKPNDWRTGIFGDSPRIPLDDWEFHSGLSYFSKTIAMAIVQELALQGNQNLAAGIETLLKYFETEYEGTKLEFLRQMNSIVPDVDYFGVGYRENVAAICPELSEVFVASYLQTLPAVFSLIPGTFPWENFLPGNH